MQNPQKYCGLPVPAFHRFSHRVGKLTRMRRGGTEDEDEVSLPAKTGSAIISTENPVIRHANGEHPTSIIPFLPPIPPCICGR